MLKLYVKATETWNRLRTDQDGVVSFEYVIVAAVVVSDANVVCDLRRFVRLKVAEMLPAVAVTVYEPSLLLAVNVPALATPDPLVATWIVPVELEKVPLCPPRPAVAVKVTG